jgi:hypothetical protein
MALKIIAMLLLAVLVLPVLAGVSRLRNLPRQKRDEDPKI